MKRKASEMQTAVWQPAVVRIEYSHLPPDSRLKLDEALRSWAAWHSDRYLPGYVPPEVVSGGLAYDPEAMRLAGPEGGVQGTAGGSSGATGAAFVWEDRPAQPAKGGADTMWFNITYEKAGDVPQYDRCTDMPLAFSARKRPASEALLAADEAEGVGKPVKRLRGNSRCFNCGSYGHSMRECWREQNKEMMAQSMRERAEAREASGAAYRSAARRYYLPGAAEGGGGGGGGAVEQVTGEFEGLVPGQLTGDLRAALGIGPLAPPPWLHRMRDLGLPPGYMAPAVADAVAASAGGGSSTAAEAAEPAAANGTAATDTAAATRAAAADGAGPGEADAAEELGDFIALSHSPPPPIEAAEVDGSAPQQLVCSVQFAGVNAPLPEGADHQAWTAPAQQQQQQGYGTPQQQARWQQQQQQQGGWSAERAVGRTASTDRGRVLPRLAGLHPPRHAASETALGAAGAHPSPQPQQQAAQWAAQGQAQKVQVHHGWSAPDLRQPQQQAATVLQADQRGAVQGSARQQALPHQPASQQQLQQPAQMLGGVYSESRSDPGHLLAFGLGQAGVPTGGTGSQAGQYPMQQQQQQQVWGWGGQAAAQQRRAYAQQAYTQQQYQQQAYPQQQYQQHAYPQYEQQQQQQQHHGEQDVYGSSQQRQGQEQYGMRQQHVQDVQYAAWQAELGSASVAQLDGNAAYPEPVQAHTGLELQQQREEEEQRRRKQQQQLWLQDGR